MNTGFVVDICNSADELSEDFLNFVDGESALLCEVVI
jgi:hypothetical protein